MTAQTFDDMTEWQQHFMTSISPDQFEEVLASSTPENGHTYDVRVQINGIEVGFLGFLNVLERNYDRAVNDAASEKFRDKFAELEDSLFEVGEIIKKAENKVRSELGIEPDSWDY